MKTSYTLEQILQAKTRDLIPVYCDQCNTLIMRKKHLVFKSFRNIETQLIEKQQFCSQSCFGLLKSKAQIVFCKQCGRQRKKTLAEIKKHPNHFCSHRCNALYYNKHKTKGFVRSKLELWLEKELPKLYPAQTILFNDRKTIGIELDIFFPVLKIAFELNGIFHYEPIFGLEKLDKTQVNDKRKIIYCYEKGIELCVIDTTSMTYFKLEKAQKFLKIITDIISQKLKL